MYLLESIASGASLLSVNINARLLDTSLIDQISVNVKNEIQDLDLTSTIVLDGHSIKTDTLSVTSGVSEIQTVQIKSINGAQYALGFDQVETYTLNFEATALDVQKALNDLPTLSPNLVTVTQSSSPDDITRIFLVQFSSSLGDVPLLEETLKNVEFTAEETIKGSPSGSKVQLMIQNKPTPLFDLRDTDLNVRKQIFYFCTKLMFLFYVQD